jgi:hypothetical protein
LFELPLHACGVLIALLHLVQRQRFQPAGAGFAEVAKGRIQMAKPIEGRRSRSSIAQVVAQDEGLPVIVHGLVMLSGLVGDETKSVEAIRLSRGVVVSTM